MSYFEDQSHVNLLQPALERWAGTPFMQGQATPGLGVDCVRFVREVYRDCGVDVDPVEKIPRYSMAWGHLGDHSQILGWMHEDPAARERIVRVDREEAVVPGDLVVFLRATHHHHLGIIDTIARVWHVSYPGAVSQITWEVLKDQPGILRYRI